MQNKQTGRFHGTKINIDENDVQSFFETRAQKAQKDGCVVSMLYQDNNPDLAYKRDTYEKKKFLSLLDCNKNDHVLDLGCGVGRWTADLKGLVAHYHGIDPFPKLIKIASDLFKKDSHVTFQALSAQDAHCKLLLCKSPFSIVLNTGVLHYLNDKDCLQTIRNIPELCASRAKVLVRVPVAIHERLTLKDVASSELQCSYSAIYRTVSEYRTYFRDTLIKAGFVYLNDAPLYPEDMNNRAETQQHFFLFERGRDKAIS